MNSNYLEKFDEQSIEMLIRHCRMFNYGTTGSIEVFHNDVAQDFYHFALLHLISTMFLIDNGIFHRILDEIGQAKLLKEIDDILKMPVGDCTLGEFIRIRRNRLATHRFFLFSNLPNQNKAINFTDKSLNQFNDSFDKLIPEVFKLQKELEKLLFSNV